MITIFYRIRMANPEVLQEMKKALYSEQIAQELYQKYTGEKKTFLTRIKIACVPIILSVLAAFLEEYLPNESYIYLPILILLFAGIFFGIFSWNNYRVTNEYINALQEGYPQMVQREKEKQSIF